MRHVLAHVPLFRASCSCCDPVSLGDGGEPHIYVGRVSSEKTVKLEVFDKVIIRWKEGAFAS